MMVDEVDIPSHAVLEPKNNPPVGPDSNSPEALEVALQGMQTKRGQVGRADRVCLLQHSEDLPDLSDMLGADAPRIVLLEKLAQPSVPKTLDHRENPIVK
jgi:hypothetical protein